MATQGSRFSIGRWVIPVLAAGLFALPTLAQNAPPGGPGGGFDPSQFRQRMLDRVKDALGATDEEMQAIGPKIEKVFTLQMEMNMGRMGMMRRNQGGNGGPGGQAAPAANAAPGGTPNGQAASPLVEKTRDLQAALDNKDAKPEEIKAKLQAYRDAKAQAKADLTRAQGELRDLLTQRQEATLVMMGMLD